MPKVYLDYLIKKRTNWINKQFEKNNQYKIDNNHIYYLGDKIEIILTTDSQTDRYSLYFKDKINIIAPIKYENQKIISLLKKEYKKRAQNYIPDIIDKYSKIMNLYPKDIVYRYAKRKWASCSFENIISINPEIMKLAKESIKYIVIHELSHIKYKNHKQEFWQLVCKYMPNFSQEIKNIENISKNRDLFFKNY